MKRGFRGISRRGSFHHSIVDLTPLIDVVFVVLVMFILIAPIINIDKVILSEGKETSLEKIVKRKENNIILYVYDDNTLWLNRKKISIDNVEAILIKYKKKFPLAELQLIHDYRAQFGVYQKVKNAALGAGFDHLDVVLKSPG